MSDDAALKLAEAAHVLVQTGRFALAWDAVTLALAVDADQPNAHTLKAHLLERRGDFAAAEPHWRAAARLAPELAGNRFNLALALLNAGELTEGFALQEARLEKADWSSLAAAGSFAGLRHLVPRPGDDLARKRVLVFTEQGLGDNIWAARFLLALTARGIVFDLACPEVLRPVLAGLVPGVLLGPPADQPAAKLNLAALAGRYDVMVPMMSLPHLLGADASGARWFTPDPALVAVWRARFVAELPGKPIVGVVWRANPTSPSASARSFPPALLGGLAGVGLVNLQGGAADGRAALPDAFDPMPDGEVALDEYAAMLAATDLLISADTMAAHLAAAIGHPAWIAVPAMANFYWGRAGDASPWYPRLRIFRQPYEGDWLTVGAAIQAALGRFLLAPVGAATQAGHDPPQPGGHPPW